MAEIHALPVATVAPHSVEAEQQLLGAVLLGAANLPHLRSILSPDQFFEPFHGRLYAKCLSLSDQDKLISPVTLKAYMGDDPALQDLGVGYLARLAGASVSGSEAASYAQIIAEKAEKRALLGIVSDAQAELNQDFTVPGDVSAKVSAALDAMDFRTSGVEPVSLMSAVTKAVQETVDIQSGISGASVHTGLGSLDSIIPGMFPGELWLLGGRPSMGKSAVALNIAMNAARQGHPVVFASLEMRPEHLAVRAISEQTAERGQGVAYQDMRREGLHQTQIQNIAQASEDIANLPLWFLPREYASAELLPVGVKQSLRRYNGDRLPLVVIDYVQLMRSSKAKTRFEEITEVSLALKALAMTQGLPVLALSQLSRALESRDDKRPMLSDLRESGQLEQDADGVMFAYRDSYYVERMEPDGRDAEEMADWQAAMDACRGRLDIIVAKQRQGPIATAKMRENLALNRLWGA